MKAEGHPILNNVCFLDVASGKRFLTKSTMKSARKETIDGVEYMLGPYSSGLTEAMAPVT